MNDDTHIIKIGDDPRFLPEFSAIREEINKSNHPTQPEVNWRLVESLALTLFKSNGVDLHTATYYTLARTKLNGLSGFCEGCELLAGLITAEWERFWPQNYQARSDMLEWFNTRIGNILRRNPSLALGDLQLLYRTERTLQLICDKLQQVELKRVPRVENLLYFVQNIRKRTEAEQQAHNTQAYHYVSPTLVYMPEPTAQTEPIYSPLPSMEPAHQAPKVEVHFIGSENKKRPSRMPVIGGFLAGIVCTAIVCSGLWWWQVSPLQQKITIVNDTPQGGAALWLTSPELKEYPQRLDRLLNVSPLQPLETGEHLTKTAASVWPENEQQQQATARWHAAIKLRADNSPTLRGYMQVQQDLHEFAALLLQREKSKEGITLSYLKTVAYQAENLLNQETPLEVLLTQLEDAKKQNQNTQILEKQINERMEALSSRYLLIRNISQIDSSLNNHANTHE